MSETKDSAGQADPQADEKDEAPAEMSDETSPAGVEADSEADADTDAASETPAEAEEDAEDDESETSQDVAPPAPPPLLRLGNPLQLVRGAGTLAAGALVAFLLMALRPQYRIGVPLGVIAILVATFGVLDLCGTFDDPEERVEKRSTLADLLAPLGVFLGSTVGLFLSLSLAVAGYLGPLAAGLCITGTFLGVIVGLYQTGDKLGVWGRGPEGEPIPLLRRQGFWLVALVTLMYLPMLGSHSLSDPWETHYGEVAREILARNDWISLWWAQDGWFWSKPIFDFWIQALAMAALGVRYFPGSMLSAVAEGRTPWPEWAVRMPIFLLTLLATYILYKAVARVFGRRAGFLGGLVLSTMPQWFLVTHQTMTDMPFVATMSAAMGLFLLGIHEEPERDVRVYELKIGGTPFRLSAYHLVLGMIVACAVPQVLYLFSRNLEIVPSPFSLKFHADAFRAGSPMNCGLPGNEACKDVASVIKGLQPSLQALLWLQAICVLLYMSWGERRAQRLYFLAAWFFAALSTMAKGPAGLGLPVLCALSYVVVTKRWRDLLRLEIVGGVLILFAVAMPWFVAMFARHGAPFTDRLIIHDMFKRAFTHVHDTNEGDDVSFRFYVWQLGYAMFPWTGLVPAGLVAWLRRSEANDKRSDASIFLAMWFVFGFALFTYMLTKFHHYILPALPPAAMLTGVLLDEMVERSDLAEMKSALWRKLVYVAGVGAATGLLLYGFYLLRGTPPFPTADIARGVTTFSAAMSSLFKHSAVGLGVAALGVGVLFGSSFFARRSRMFGPAAEVSGPVSERAVFVRQYEAILLGAVGVAGGLVVFFVGRDLFGAREGMLDQARLLHLFTYNYKRQFPPSLDFHAALFAFTCVAAILTFSLVRARMRPHIVNALCATGVLFAIWGIDVYFVKVSPHYGQRETMLAYYRAKQEIPGPIIAFQMNWKGENFYTGNAVPAFVSSGKKFQDYILEQKKKGVKTFYFMTEHGRMGSLANELGGPRIFDKLTTPELNNKFGLVRATFE